MTQHAVIHSNCPVCTEIAIRVQQIVQERDTWYQPGKRRKENAPFVVGGEV
jgi:hypothetical protein